jgi:hypothetical protein
MPFAMGRSAGIAAQAISLLTSPLRGGRNLAGGARQISGGGSAFPLRPPPEVFSPLARPSNFDLPARGRLHSVSAGLILLFAVTCWVAVASTIALAEEAIENFRSDIVLDRDGTVHVIETIRVRAEGNVIRRGIYRDISTTFEDADGKVHRVAFKLLDVTRDGRSEPHFIERHSDFLRIYAGDENVFLPTGSYTYVITYESDRQVRWLDNKPELFWNVTGNDWSFPILKASATLKLPDGVAPVRFDAYTGMFNERGGDWQGGVGDGVLNISTTRRLEPNEGLSIVAEIPAAAVDRPAASDEARYFFLDHREWFIGGVGFLIVLGYFLWAWNRVGRDPKGGTIIPLFHPPEGVSAALASYIRNWGFGSNAWKAFTASALSLAVRGMIVFDQEGKDLVLERTDASFDIARGPLSPGEKTVLDWVEKQGGRAEIKSSNGKSVAKVGEDFKSSVRKEGGSRYFKRNILHFVLGVVLSVLTVVAIFVFGNLSQEDFGLFIGMLFVGIFLSFFLVPIIASLFGGRGVMQIITSLMFLAVVLGFLLFFASSFLSDFAGEGGSIVTSLLVGARDHAFPVALMIVFPILNGLFFYLLRAPTPEGRPVMDQIEGFRMYMETAESGRLNIDKSPEITSERFEALLPYAVALDVERPWANAFASALARAHPGDTDPMSHYHSRWRRGGSWSSDNFGRSVSSAIASATSAATSSLPRSSSSSSGFSGGSGGGGGGRGGGGW